MATVELSAGDVEQIQTLVQTLASSFDSTDDPDFLREVDVFAHELPRRIRRALCEFRLTEPPDAIVKISGYPIDEHRIGPTPGHWRDRVPGSGVVQEEILLILLGSLLGDVIGWSTQQCGRIVHDILPIAGHEHEQLGSGSEELLTWHVEDAFHPYRGDYLGMMCLRNPDRVPTTFAAVTQLDLDPVHAERLSEPRFTIRPDESHLQKNRAGEEDDDFLIAAYDKIERMQERPEKIPVLFGDLRAPYLRLDPYFMDPPADDPEAQESLEYIIETIDGALRDQVLGPGEICFIDNYQAVHGRRPFKARHDGTDRWLKRINIARDLRRSREWRRTAESRVIY